MRNKFFKYLLLVTALVVAGVAAYFSVFGLSKLFAGAFIAAVIMASSLEIGKLILSSYLYRLWSSISTIRRTYGVIAVGILMLITSVGIYGFLSNAFEKTSMEVEKMDSTVEILDTRITNKEQEIDRYRQLIDDKQTRIVTLTELRKSQETRLDSLLANEHWINASRTTESINSADEEIQNLYREIDELNIKVDSSNNRLINLKTEKLEYKGSNTITGEIGPLKYISRLTGRTMDKVVNWVILLLIFVFDPLAIYLILSYNHLALKNEEEIEPKKIKEEKQVVNKEYTKEEKETYQPKTTQFDNDIRKKLSNKYSEISKKKVKETSIEDNEVKTVDTLNSHIKKKKGTIMDPKTGGIQNIYEENK